MNNSLHPLFHAVLAPFAPPADAADQVAEPVVVDALPAEQDPVALTAK